MRQGRDRFDAVIASTPAGSTPGEIKQGLINLASSTLRTITPELWAKQLRATQRPGGTLQPYDFSRHSPAELEGVRQQAARAEAVRSADQELALQSTSAPSPASAPEKEPPTPSSAPATDWQALIDSQLQQLQSQVLQMNTLDLWRAAPEHLRPGVTFDEVVAYVISKQELSTPSPALHSQTLLEAARRRPQVVPAVHTPASPPEPHSSLRERRCTAAIQETAAAEYLSGRLPTPVYDLLAAIS